MSYTSPVTSIYPNSYYRAPQPAPNLLPYRRFGQNFELPSIQQPLSATIHASQSTADDIEDTLLDPRQHLSRSEVLTYLGIGFTLGFTGKEILRLTAKKNHANFDGDITLHQAPNKTGKRQKKTVEPADPFGIPPVQIWRYYKDPLPSMMRAVQEDPTLAKGLFAYAGIGILGYLTGSLVKGTKETWVRREETNIRARLVARMRAVVQASIRSKHAFNIQLRKETKAQLLTMLTQNNIIKPHELLNLPSSPVPADYLFFYQPTHRTLPVEAISNYENPNPNFGYVNPTGPFKKVSHLRFGTQSIGQTSSNTSASSSLLTLQKGVITGVGFLFGLVVQNFMRLFTDALPQQVPKSLASSGQDATSNTNVKTKESIQLNDLENWSLLAFKNKSNLMIAMGLFSMTGAASVGAQLIDGLREIEVTRLNAKTELDYQKHNWLTQDPQFHEIAEREAVHNDLQLLQQDLPWLRNDRVQLKQRIQTILTNIGRNSAPPYFPMTPMVSLVEARA